MRGTIPAITDPVNTTAPTKYSIKVTGPNGSISYLTHHDRNSWSKRTAIKYAACFAKCNPASGLRAATRLTHSQPTLNPHTT